MRTFARTSCHREVCDATEIHTRSLLSLVFQRINVLVIQRRSTPIPLVILLAIATEQEEGPDVRNHSSNDQGRHIRCRATDSTSHLKEGNREDICPFQVEDSE